jgi:hypothetical protein
MLVKIEAAHARHPHSRFEALMSIPIDPRYGVHRMVLGNDSASIVAAIQGVGNVTTRPTARSDQDLLALIKAIRVTFPVVCRLMDDRAEYGAIHEYVRNTAGVAGVLLDCGESFSHCLEQFPAADDLPFLPDLARFEWVLERARRAPEPANRAALSSIHDGDVLDVTFALHPSLLLLETTWPIDDIWEAARHTDGPMPAIAASPQMTRLLIFRAGSAAVSTRLGAAQMSFLQAIGDGTSLPGAIEIAFRVDDWFDPLIMLRDLFDKGLVVGIVPANPRRTPARPHQASKPCDVGIITKRADAGYF